MGLILNTTQSPQHHGMTSMNTEPGVDQNQVWTTITNTKTTTKTEFGHTIYNI